MRDLIVYSAAASGSVMVRMPCRPLKNFLVNPALVIALKVAFCASGDQTCGEKAVSAVVAAYNGYAQKHWV